MSLHSTLSGLFKQARQRHSPQQTTLFKGLYIRAHHQLPQFFVWREQGEWHPGEAAEREAYTCANALGWGDNCLLEWKGRYLIVTRAEQLLEATG